MTLAYNVPSGLAAQDLAEVFRSEGYSVTGDAKPRVTGYAVTVHDDDADVEALDAIARSVTSGAAVRLP